MRPSLQQEGAQMEWSLWVPPCCLNVFSRMPQDNKSNALEGCRTVFGTNISQHRPTPTPSLPLTPVGPTSSKGMDPKHNTLPQYST